MRGASVLSPVDGWVPGHAAATSVMIDAVVIFWRRFLATSDFNHINASDARASNKLARTIAQIRTGHWLCASYLQRIRNVSDRCWWFG
jgi:hypothetical protein